MLSIPVDTRQPSLYQLLPSRIYSVLLFFVYSLAILIVFILPVAEFFIALVTFLLLWFLVHYLRRDAWLLLSSSLVAIRLDGEDIVLFTRDGRELHGRVLGDSVVTPLCTILNILIAGIYIKRSIVIFPDSLEKAHFRELRVRLKWGG
jgi:toxin CptA